MPLLFDTCAAMWVVESKPMKALALAALDEVWQKGEAVFVSPITGWEVGLLAMKGRFRSQYSPQRWLDVLLALPQIRVSEMPPQMLLQSCFLPGFPPREPSDRIIAATAREYGFTVMTRDKALLDYGREGHLSVLEC